MSTTSICAGRSLASRTSSSSSRSLLSTRSVSSNRDLALREVSTVAETDQRSGTVALRYVARAGLLPELSRQTYDTFPKALREAVLNALDAEATRVDIDFSRVDTSRRISVQDDGLGMSMP